MCYWWVEYILRGTARERSLSHCDHITAGTEGALVPLSPLCPGHEKSGIWPTIDLCPDVQLHHRLEGIGLPGVVGTHLESQHTR